MEKTMTSKRKSVSKKTAMLRELSGVAGAKLIFGCCYQGCCGQPELSSRLVARRIRVSGSGMHASI
jgi:hypothetical protein